MTAQNTVYYTALARISHSQKELKLGYYFSKGYFLQLDHYMDLATERHWKTYGLRKSFDAYFFADYLDALFYDLHHLAKFWGVSLKPLWAAVARGPLQRPPRPHW